MSLSKKQGILLGEGNAFGKDDCFWKRRILLEKTNAFGKDECFLKRRMLLEKTNAFGKENIFILAYLDPTTIVYFSGSG